MDNYQSDNYLKKFQWFLSLNSILYFKLMCPVISMGQFSQATGLILKYSFYSILSCSVLFCSILFYSEIKGSQN